MRQQMSTNDLKNNHSKRHAHCEVKKTCSRTDLAVFINVIFEVVIFGDDGFGDERLVDDTDGGQQGGTVRISQPCDLCGLLVVLVVQIQASLHGHNLTISPSE